MCPDYIIIYQFFYNQMQPEQTQSYANCQYANDYKVHFLLGEGGQADVYLGSKAKQLYALKVYLPGFNKQEAFKREVQFLENLKFPHLINMVEAHPNAEIKLKNKGIEHRSLIVLEFAEGEMFDFISKQGRFAPQITRTLFKQLLLAIKFLDDRGVTHRDLKPENILFDRDFNLKVSDFGLSTMTEGYNKDGILYSRVGTEGYKPPEMERGQYTGIQADLFAAGVILFVMYNGTPPFLSTKPHDKIYKLIKEQNYKKFWALHEKKKPAGFYPLSFKRLLSEFFSEDPAKRPTLKSLLEDEWLNGQLSTSQQLKAYMKGRYDKIAEEDELKRKIAKIRKELFDHEDMQEEKPDQQEQSSRGQAVNVFVERKKEYNAIKISDLPQTQKKITYFNKDIGFVLAFLKDYIEQCAKNKETFIEDFLQEIEPSKFEMKVLDKEVDLKFTFDIDEEDEEIIKLKGKLYQNNEKFGIEWQKVAGNDFWLSSIIGSIERTLKVLV